MRGISNGVIILSIICLVAANKNGIEETSIKKGTTTKKLSSATNSTTEIQMVKEEGRKDAQTSPGSETSINQLSEGSTPKVARHLNPKMFLKEKFLVGIKRPWFTSKLGDRQMVIVKKVQGNPTEADAAVPSLSALRYAPLQRSFDMGMGGLVNNFDWNQGVLPTSGTPNSLDHLYLPDMITKDFGKPLEFNGIGNSPSDATSSATGDFVYGRPANFREPVDINHHRSNIEHANFGRIDGRPTGTHQQHYSYRGSPSRGGGGMGVKYSPHSSEHRDAPRGGSSHSHDDGPPRPPQPAPPIKPLQTSDFPKDEDNEKHHSDERLGSSDDRPPGAHLVQGDAGFHNIIDLANLINSHQFPLANLQASPDANFQGSSSGPNQNDNAHFNGPPKHLHDEYQDENYRHFDKERDFVPGRSGGRRQYGYDDSRNSEEQGEYNEFAYNHQNKRLPGHPEEGYQSSAYSGSTRRPDFDQERPDKPDFDNDHHQQYNNHRNNSPNRERGSSTNWNRQRPNHHHSPGRFERPRGENQDMSYLNGKDGNDGSFPEDGPNNHDSDFDYDDRERRPYSSSHGGESSSYDDNSRDFPNGDDYQHSTNSKDTKTQQGQYHQRPFESPGFDDDYNNSPEQFDSPQRNNSQEQGDLSQKPNTKNKVHRTPNGFGELMGFDTK